MIGLGFVYIVLGDSLAGEYDSTDLATVALIGDGNWGTLGGGLAAAGDIDADGFSDFWVSGNNKVRLFSGGLVFE